MTLYEKAVEQAAKKGIDWTLAENHPKDRVAEALIGTPRKQHVKSTRQHIGFEREPKTENSRVVKGTRKLNGGTVNDGVGSPMKLADADTTLGAQTDAQTSGNISRCGSDLCSSGGVPSGGSVERSFG